MGMSSPNNKDDAEKKSARMSDASESYTDSRSSQKTFGFHESDVHALTRERSNTGDLVATTEVETTTETVAKDGAKSTSVSTEVNSEVVGSAVVEAKKEGANNSEDVQTQVFKSHLEDGRVETKTVRTTTRKVAAAGSFNTVIEVQTTIETVTKDGTTSTSVSKETKTNAGNCLEAKVEITGGATATEETEGKLSVDEAFMGSDFDRKSLFACGEKSEHYKQWHPQFVAYVNSHGKSLENLSTMDMLECSRAFCRERLSEFDNKLFDGNTIEEDKACWKMMKQLAIHYPLVAVQLLAPDFGKKNMLILDKGSRDLGIDDRSHKEVVVFMLERSKANACEIFDDLLILQNGEVAYYGTAEGAVEYFYEFGYQATSNHSVSHSTEEVGSDSGESVKTEVFRSEEADGSIVTKTIRTTTRSEATAAGELVTTIEVETTTETEATDGTKSTTVATETREETTTEVSETTITNIVLAANEEFLASGVGDGEGQATARAGTTGLLSTENNLIGLIDAAYTCSEENKSLANYVKQTKEEVEESAMTSYSVAESQKKQTACAAAAWGEEASSPPIKATNELKCTQDLLLLHGHSLRIAVDELSCAVPMSETSPIDVIRGVTGYMEAGEMTAILGATRAGKAAFLGALAGEETPTHGKVLYNGHEASALVRRRATGYCWFGNEYAVANGTTTVREALCFSAYLRQPHEISDSRKLEIVDFYLELLGLKDVADKFINVCTATEFRLVAIGVELAFAPSVLLLDEPTNGLDKKDTLKIIHVLQRVAQMGCTIVCSLGDTASSTEFRAFNRTLFLSSSGEVIFHGESHIMEEYLGGLPGVKKLTGKSITGWALKSAGVSNMTTTRDGRSSTNKQEHTDVTSMLTEARAHLGEETSLVQFFQQSELKCALLAQMERAGYLRAAEEENVPALITAERDGKLTAFASSKRTQITWLTRRVVLSYWRSLFSIASIRSTMITAFNANALWQRASVVGVFTAALMWLSWFFTTARNTEYDTFDGVNEGTTLIAWSTLTVGASLGVGAVAGAWRENGCWCREQAWQTYPALIYHACSSIVELLFVLGITFVVGFVTFSLFNFWSVTTISNFSWYWFVLAIFALSQFYFGQWLARMSPNDNVAAAAAAGINLLPLVSFVCSWRSSVLGSFIWLLMLLTPQRFALQVLQAIVFGATEDSCVTVAEAAGVKDIPCRELRLIPSDGPYFSGPQQLTVHSYAELEYGAERSRVAFRLAGLVAFLVAFRFITIVALQKRARLRK
ncbi:hypothetical protein PHYBOEH_008117 [Phytophthora boehmeriae]|uniref:ABC transporter domain-containing protein n=1 Tax=Phytophthora boehmeriae TaxID=109152 RepID=A0A8T1W6K4_9STRA|nr:hypothetical protein PHYBOEH_008117 [Phytophthora boehmeriae]